MKLIIGLSLIMSATSYAGSSFNEVKNIILNSPQIKSDTNSKESADALSERASYARGVLPQYEVSMLNMFKFGKDTLANMASATINETDDYYPRLNKLIHSNGICFTGEWKISEQNPYSGLFKRGSQALLIARISAATSNTVAPDRAFGFAAKIFPTQNPEQKVETANFFTVDTLLGTSKSHFIDTELTNEPDTGLPSLAQFFNGTVKVGSFIQNELKKADKNIGFRPIYPISLAGLNPGEKEKTPHWIKISPSNHNSLVDEKDFRNELNIKKYHPNGITLDIYVSDTTHEPVSNGWTRIGSIVLKQSVVSYGCDRQLHFHHPKLRAQDSFEDDNGGY